MNLKGNRTTFRKQLNQFPWKIFVYSEIQINIFLKEQTYYKHIRHIWKCHILSITSTTIPNQNSLTHVFCFIFLLQLLSSAANPAAIKLNELFFCPYTHVHHPHILSASLWLITENNRKLISNKIWILKKLLPLGRGLLETILRITTTKYKNRLKGEGVGEHNCTIILHP